MRQLKIEDGERMTYEQEATISGKTPYQKRMAMDAKLVRSYIAAHPGVTEKHIRAATGVKNTGKVVTWLVRRNLLKQTFMGLEVVPL